MQLEKGFIGYFGAAKRSYDSAGIPIITLTYPSKLCQNRRKSPYNEMDGDFLSG
jgi:hypothetical protein